MKKFVCLLLALMVLALPVWATDAVPAAEADPLAQLVADANGGTGPVASAPAVAPSAYTIDNPPAKPKALKDVESAGAQLRYLGEANGLQGWIAMRQGQPEYYYVTADGKAVLMGVMFDASNGALITGQQLAALKIGNPQAFAELMRLNNGAGQGPAAAATAAVAGAQSGAAQPAPNSPSEMLIKTLGAASGFTMGDASAPLLYAFIDPECPHCKRFLQTVVAQKLLEGKKLAIRVLPVAKNKTSAQKAAYLLAIPNAGDILLKSVSDPAGAYANMPADLSTGAVERNVQMLMQFKFEMTPSFVYRGKDGKVKIIRGLPEDLGPMLVDLGAGKR